MSYFLDTNILIYLMKRRPSHLLERFNQERPRNLTVSSLAVAELYFGVEKSARADANRDALEQFLQPFQIHDFGAEAAQTYGRLRAVLERSGTPLGPLDTLIAAHALSMDATLVTNNTHEFERVSKLRLENWAEA